jgi:hypothetical protein
MWTRGHACYMLAKNLSTFCSCPDILNDAEFNGDRLIWQRKFQNSTAFRLWHDYCWLVLAIFIVRMGVKIRLERLKLCRLIRRVSVKLRL